MAAAPISFYFGIQDGQHANLDTIALASMEWVALVRDLAAVIAPDLVIEVEFIESEAGSVWLTNMIKAVHSGDRKALAALVVAVLVFFGSGPALHIQTDVGDEFWARLGHDHGIELSDEDKADIAARVVRALDETSAEQRRRNLIEIAEGDEQITSVGVDTIARKGGPITKISRESFPSYDELPAPPTERSAKEVRYERNIGVEVVKASLRKNEARPRWRFRQGKAEWSATIEDDEFIWALNNDKTGLHLAVGQQMRLDLAVDVRLVDDVMIDQDRRIIRVHEPRVDRAQSELGLGGE